MKRLTVLLVCLLSVAMISGCSSRWVQSSVVDKKNMNVSLEHRLVKGEIVQKQFNHPYDMDSLDLKFFLAQLDYFDEPAFYGDPKTKPVFQKEEIERLAPALTAALGKAAPHQRVRFISYNRGGGLFFKKDRKTRGVLFVEPDNRLNLAFSHVNHEIRERELQRFSEAEETLNPLEIKSSNTPIVAPDFARYKRSEEDGKHSMWVTADIEEIARAAVSVPEKEEKTFHDGAESAETAEDALPDKAPAVRSRQETAPPSEKTVPDKTAPEPPAQAPGDTWKSRKADIRERLEYLKELYESDLIDAEDYETQKKKLLEQLELNPD